MCVCIACFEAPALVSILLEYGVFVSVTPFSFIPNQWWRASAVSALIEFGVVPCTIGGIGPVEGQWCPIATWSTPEINSVKPHRWGACLSVNLSNLSTILSSLLCFALFCSALISFSPKLNPIILMILFRNLRIVFSATCHQVVLGLYKSILWSILEKIKDDVGRMSFCGSRFCYYSF